jgi:PhzF family phenazine biosynthesis protein
MILKYRVVDAFTSRPFQGNPAAVVLDGDELSDSRMQQIAAEFNLSETVFVLHPASQQAGTCVRLRWFTPQCEVSFCGHASLAAIHSFCESAFEEGLAARRSDVAIQCAAGNLSMKIESAPDGARRYWLSMPRPDTYPVDFATNLLIDALQLPPQAECQGSAYRTRDRDVIVFLSSGEHLRSATPDMAKLDRLSRHHDVRGVSVASIDSGDASVACISRFFAPAAGIAEDPVTGSVHGPLAALLIHGSHVQPVRPGQWSFLCRQVPRSGRVGNVHVRAETRSAELAVEVGGSCVTVMSGRISV